MTKKSKKNSLEGNDLVSNFKKKSRFSFEIFLMYDVNFLVCLVVMKPGSVFHENI
jgi:hypothetical protein